MKIQKKTINLLIFCLFFLFLDGIGRTKAEPSQTSVRVGIYHNPPLVSIGPTGTPRGLFIDILIAIAGQENWNLQFLRGTWSDQLTRLETGKIDLLPAIAIDDTREKQFLFIDETVIANWAQVFVPEDSPVQSIPDLDGLTIAVLSDDIYYTGEPGIAAICRSFNIDCELKAYPSYEQVLMATARNKVDAGLVNRLFGATEGLRYTPIPSPIVLMPTDIRIAISHETPHKEILKERIDHHLHRMKTDELSIYHTQLRKLFGNGHEEREQPTWLLRTFILSLLVVLGLFLVVQVMRWRIRQQTRELSHQEMRYKGFFDAVAISFWEGDSSRLLHRLQQLIHTGIRDINTYFDDHPDELRTWVRQIRIVSANPATLRLFGVNTVEELQSWIPHAFTPSAYSVFQQTLVAASKKQRVFTGELDLLTFDRQPIRVIIFFPISYRLEESCRVPVSMLDVTHQRQTEKRLSQVIQGASLGFWDWNLITDELTVNDRWTEMLGLDRSTLTHGIADFEERIHPEDAPITLPAIREHIQAGTPYTLEFRLRHADNHWVWIQGAGAVVEYDPSTNQPLRACGTHENITERKHAEETLHTLMRSMVGITGEDFFERAARELCHWFHADGANIGEVVEKNRIVALSTIVDGKVVEDFQYHLRGTPCNQVVMQGPHLYPEGVQELFPTDQDLIVLNIEGYAGVPIRNIKGEAIGVVWVVSRQPLRMESDWKDVMEIIAARISAEIERKRATEKLQHRATFDSLTDLPNRRLLIDRLTQAQARCRRHAHKGAVIFMDLDHFKTINDTLGHTVGDLLLIEVAKRLQGQIRDEDTASRLGGDEFVVLFSELDGDPQVAAQQARTGAKKIQTALSEPYTIQGNQLHITPSLGIVIFPMDDENADDILKYADSAMYRAKEAGRNTIRFFLPEMHQSAEVQLQLQNDLRHAISHQELDLYFQPMVDGEGRTLSAEVLLRWPHPTHGTVEPKDFLHVAEESGQILEICNWVLTQALTRCKPWIEAHPWLQGISVNIHSALFHQAGFTENLEKILHETGFNPQHLTLEIHEATLASNLEEAATKIDHLQQLGVRFSIDRFGIDYASVSFLRKFALHELKIDRSIVGRMLSDPEDAKLVQTLISLAQQMEIHVVAVGVENESQLNFLRDNGCRLFQGYYFARPQPADQFINHLNKQS
ncbi:MAG: EAL domain-containing protein [Candidatus Thiodiazotropha sp. (ex Monitilora ramsayi)]|nr:EAL domain-containing protein [Candidatus Thiodiazotropha sp. (ex Monitilora ramsayi)]